MQKNRDLSKRPDLYGNHNARYKKNKQIILQRNEYCAICGGYVDKELKFPHPMSPSVDHIIPVSKGGHPSNLSNLQLTHLICNMSKGAKFVDSVKQKDVKVRNDDLPHLVDWKNYRSE